MGAVISFAAITVANLAVLNVLYRRCRQLEAQAITDSLTGAFNRRYMELCLATAIERRNRIGEPASLLFVDVDRFKPINDTLGHLAGDELLKALVELISARTRKLDTLFRVGGEEFVLLVPGARYVDALALAEHLRQLVAGARLLEERPVSISVGVSELRAGLSAAAWLNDADAALYRAKQGGRNRVAGRVCASAPPRSAVS